MTRHGLRSVDSGTHTCNAADVWGHSGTATVVMNVTGKVALPPNKFVACCIIPQIGKIFAV